MIKFLTIGSLLTGCLLGAALGLDSLPLMLIGGVVGIVTFSPLFFFMIGPMRWYDRELTKRLTEQIERLEREHAKAKVLAPKG